MKNNSSITHIYPEICKYFKMSLVSKISINCHIGVTEMLRFWADNILYNIIGLLRLIILKRYSLFALCTLKYCLILLQKLEQWIRIHFTRKIWVRNIYIMLCYETWNIYEFYNTQLSNGKCSESDFSVGLIL